MSVVYDTYFLHSITISFLFRDDKFPHLGQLTVILTIQYVTCPRNSNLYERYYCNVIYNITSLMEYTENTRIYQVYGRETQVHQVDKCS